MPNVTLTAQQINYVQRLLREKMEAEATASTAYSGHLANTPNFRSADLVIVQSTLKSHQVGGLIVSLTAQQVNYLLTALIQEVADESKTNPAYSGHSANTPTFQSGELVVAKSVLAAIQAVVL